MLQLESENPLVREAFTNALDDKYQPINLDRIITDFDFTTYHISTPESKTKILFSIGIKCWDDLVKYGVVQVLKECYPSNVSILDQLEPGYNYSLYIDLENLSFPDTTAKEEFITSLTFLKRNAFAAPFLKAFERYDVISKDVVSDPNNFYGEDATTSDNNKEEILTINYRDQESIYIRPSTDRVTVIFSTVFKDDTDKTLSKIFLQEFSDARKRSVQKAPQVINSHKEPPLEIRHLTQGGYTAQGEELSYITFVLFPRHLTPQVRWSTITHIQLFRSYFHYHIKIAKCYLHQRMRYRVSGFTKVLNRARRDTDDEVAIDGSGVKERKTAQGRRFEVRA